MVGLSDSLFSRAFSPASFDKVSGNDKQAMINPATNMERAKIETPI